jgi:hypothetical protein
MALLNTLDNLSNYEALLGLLSISKIAAILDNEIGKYFYKSEWIIELDQPLESIEVVIDDGQAMGLPGFTQQETLAIDNRILLVNDYLQDPMEGTWLMHYNFHEHTKTLFFWQTKMLVIRYDQKPYRKVIKNDSAQTS